MEELIKNKWIIGSIIILIFGIITIKAVNAPIKSPEQKFSESLTSATAEIDNAVEVAVKTKLEFPDEANFSDQEGFTIIDLSRNKAGTRGNVTGKNAFGIQKMMRYDAVFTLLGGHVTIEKTNVLDQ